MATIPQNSLKSFPRHLVARLLVELPSTQPYIFYAYFAAVIWWVSGYWATGLYYSLTNEVPVALQHIGLSGMSLGLALGGLVTHRWWLLGNLLPFIYSLNLLQSLRPAEEILARGFGSITLVSVVGLIWLEFRRYRSRPQGSVDVWDSKQGWWFTMMVGLVAVVSLLMLLTWLNAS